MRLLTPLFILTLGASLSLGQNSFQLGFWNVENLFDTTNSAYTNDVEFTPNGRNEWTEERLVFKFKQLAKVIHDMDQSQDLAILGLAEIENYSVLNRLNQEFVMRDFEIVHKESPDERGIDCAILYDPQQVTLVNSHFIPVYLAGDEKTRDIVEAEFISPEGNPDQRLYVFVNHWPSRWGGQDKTDPLRRRAAATLRTRIDEILVKHSDADIVILGDFNDYPSDDSILKVLKASVQTLEPYPGDLINTTWDLHLNPNAGTIKYRGDWGVLDQIIISYGLANNYGFQWSPNSTQAFMPDYLIESEGKYSGWPYRMFRRGNYQGGYSDHLPVFCRINYYRQ